MVETEVISNLDSSSVSVIANAWVEVCESDAENNISSELNMFTNKSMHCIFTLNIHQQYYRRLEK